MNAAGPILYTHGSEGKRRVLEPEVNYVFMIPILHLEASFRGHHDLINALCSTNIRNASVEEPSCTESVLWNRHWQNQTTSTPQLPFKTPQIPSNRSHKALNRDTLGGLGRHQVHRIQSRKTSGEWLPWVSQHPPPYGSKYPNRRYLPKTLLRFRM